MTLQCYRNIILPKIVQVIAKQYLKNLDLQLRTKYYEAFEDFTAGLIRHK